MFDSFFSCSMVLTYSDLSLVRWSLLILTWQGLVCGVPVLLVQRVTVALALRFAAAGVRTDWLKMCGRGAHAPLPRALWTTPLRLGTAPGALSFLLTARLVDCLSRRMALRARVIRASYPALPVYEKRASAVLAGQ